MVLLRFYTTVCVLAVDFTKNWRISSHCEGLRCEPQSCIFPKALVIVVVSNSPVMHTLFPVVVPGHLQYNPAFYTNRILPVPLSAGYVNRNMLLKSLGPSWTTVWHSSCYTSPTYLQTFNWIPRTPRRRLSGTSGLQQKKERWSVMSICSYVLSVPLQTLSDLATKTAWIMKVSMGFVSS